MKKYRLRIDFWIDAIQLTKGDTVDETSTGYQYAKSGYVELLKRIVENNPDIFEEVKPVEMEGEIIALEHNGENDKRILIQTEQNLIDTMIGRTVKLIIE